MNIDELRAEVDRGAVDTVLLALTDMQGRLQGKRLTARHFLAEVAEHGAIETNADRGEQILVDPAGCLYFRRLLYWHGPSLPLDSDSG